MSENGHTSQPRVIIRESLDVLKATKKLLETLPPDILELETQFAEETAQEINDAIVKGERFMSKIPVTDFKLAFHKAHLLHQNIEELTEENISEHSIEDERLKLLHETDEYYVVLTMTDTQCADIVDVIWKPGHGRADYEMRSIEC